VGKTHRSLACGTGCILSNILFGLLVLDPIPAPPTTGTARRLCQRRIQTDQITFDVYLIILESYWSIFTYLGAFAVAEGSSNQKIPTPAVRTRAATTPHMTGTIIDKPSSSPNSLGRWLISRVRGLIIRRIHAETGRLAKLFQHPDTASLVLT
jgi:hypothetical protein